MPRPVTRLSNCYVPLPLNAATRKTTTTTTSTTSKKEEEKGKTTTTTETTATMTRRRLNDRKSYELRQLCLETSIFTDSLGSSLVELGHTKVICRVSIVPGEIIDTGVLDCKVQLAPHIGVNPISQRMQLTTPATETTTNTSSSSSSTSNNNNNNNNNKTLFHSGRLHSQNMMKESYLSKQLHSAIESSIQLHLFPKCTIQVRITILQDDGSVLSACITSATLALVDGNIPLYDVVTSCTVAVVLLQQKKENEENEKEEEVDDDETSYYHYYYLADPDEKELLIQSNNNNNNNNNAATTTTTTTTAAYICLALTCNHKEVTLWDQSGKSLSADVANEAIELARNGCRTMHKFMKELWISKKN